MASKNVDQLFSYLGKGFVVFAVFGLIYLILEWIGFPELLLAYYQYLPEKTIIEKSSKYTVYRYYYGFDVHVVILFFIGIIIAVSIAIYAMGIMRGKKR